MKNSDISGEKQLPSIQINNNAEEILLSFDLPADALSSTIKTEKGVSLAYSGQVDMNLLSSALPGINEGTH